MSDAFNVVKNWANCFQRHITSTVILREGGKEEEKMAKVPIVCDCDAI